MRAEKDYDRRIAWAKEQILEAQGIRIGIIELPTKVKASICVGRNEAGWEHVSIDLYKHRLPTWEEMCYVKNIFWDEEEEVVQIHPRKSEYVNMAEALHLWRPVNGDWSLLNSKKEGEKEQ
jgi:hypothetical protein